MGSGSGEAGQINIVAALAGDGRSTEMNAATERARVENVAAAVNGHPQSLVMVGGAEALGPAVVAAGVEAGHKSIIDPLAGEIGAAEADRAAAICARNVRVPGAIYGNATARIDRGTTKTFRPAVLAAGVEAGHEDISLAFAGELGAAKANGCGELTGDVDVAIGVHRNIVGVILTCATKGIGPAVLAAGCEADQKYVVISRLSER